MSQPNKGKFIQQRKDTKTKTFDSHELCRWNMAWPQDTVQIVFEVKTGKSRKARTDFWVNVFCCYALHPGSIPLIHSTHIESNIEQSNLCQHSHVYFFHASKPFIQNPFAWFYFIGRFPILSWFKDQSCFYCFSMFFQCGMAFSAWR